MFQLNGGKCAVAAMLIASAPALFGAMAFDDIPGDGSIGCSLASNPLGSTATCDASFIGTVAATGGDLTGSLLVGGSTLDLTIGNGPAFVTFGGGSASNGTVGPLGLNPLYDPQAANSGLNNAERDVTKPVTGQLLNFTITNDGPQSISAIAFYLLLNPDDYISNPGFSPQNDGLTFGVYCTGMIDASDPADGCNSGTNNFALLSAPTGAGTLNAADLNPETDTYGDLLRFSGFNLAPSQSAQFSFFITDYKPTRHINTGGKLPSEEFALAIVPTTSVTVIPEPGTVTLVLCAVAAGLVWRRKRA